LFGGLLHHPNNHSENIHIFYLPLFKSGAQNLFLGRKNIGEVLAPPPICTQVTPMQSPLENLSATRNLAVVLQWRHSVKCNDSVKGIPHIILTLWTLYVTSRVVIKELSTIISVIFCR
jgi:hypothetical protein